MTDSAGLVTQVGFDGQGMQRWVRGPDGAVTVTLVDGLGRPTHTIQNYDDGVVGGSEPADQDVITETGYDSGGRRVAVADGLGRITRFGYDLRDQLSTVTANSESTTTCPSTTTRTDCTLLTQYRYDRAGNRLTVTDARGVVVQQVAYTRGERAADHHRCPGHRHHLVVHNQRGQVIERDMPTVLGYDRYDHYDALGRPTHHVVNPFFTTQSWTYDILGAHRGRGR